MYPNYDSLMSLAVAAGATTRIRLLSGVLLAPLYPPVWLAKAAASLDAMSGGRLALGLGVGGRPDDFEAMGRPMSERGRAMDQALDLMHRAWAGENVAGGDFAVTPAPSPGGVRLLVGGNGDAAVRRTVRYGQGWIAGGGGPEAAAPLVARVRDAWREAGRDGEPHFAALAYFGLGDDTASRASLRAYYGFLGEWVDQIVDSVLRSPQALTQAVKDFGDAGVHEIAFCPTVPHLGEVDRLADVVL